MSVPPGRYAWPVGGGRLVFCEVDRSGRVLLLVGGSRWRLSPAQQRAYLRTIAANPAGALATYGREIGTCGCCGRTLTGPLRARGIGPDCAVALARATT